MFSMNVKMRRTVVRVASCLIPPCLSVASCAPIDCKNPICEDKMIAFEKALNFNKHQKNVQVAPQSSNAVMESCPLDRRSVGVASWSLLHTVAAYYPDLPGEKEKESATALIFALAELYPCKHCAEDFRQNIQLMPPNVDTREKFCLWLCQQHNLVNEKLSKPIFPCNINSLDERWKYGTPHCLNSSEENSLNEGDSL
jgi:mitochondrial FAD-linked sulfhydryl oxidase